MERPSSSHLYDGDSKRASKTVGGLTTAYTYDVNASLPVLLDDGSRKYVWGLGLAYAVDSSGVLVYHTDGLGSVRAITDGAGVVVQTYRYDEYGAPTESQGSVVQPFQYTGEVWDAETGLLYLRARMYDPGAGRFLQADPLRQSGGGSGGWNRYGYADNSPTNATDPSGLRTYFIGGVGGSDDRIFDAFVGDMADAGIRYVIGPVTAYDTNIAAHGMDWGKGLNSTEVAARGLGLASDPDASRLAQRILKQEDGPLAEREQLNIVAISGGATVAFNTARILSDHDVTVHNIVTMGGAAFNGYTGGNVDQWVKISAVDAIAFLAPYSPTSRSILEWGHDDYIRTPAERQRIIRIMKDYGVR